MFSNLPFHRAKAASNALTSSGKGMLVYGDGTTTPQKRQWTGGTAFGAEGSTVSSHGVLQSVVKYSTTRNKEIFAAINDNSGNLDILKSTDDGATWSVSLAAATIGSIGGTGTSRRFDIAFEHDSGDLVLAYSKNATTNELATRVWNGSSWSSETTFDPGGTNTVVTWVELAEPPSTNNLALGYATDDSTATIENIGAALWDGSSLGNATTNANLNVTSTGVQCDQTAATPDGIDKCFDINYEWGTGLPVLNWGIQSAGNTTNIMRATRWSGSAWSSAIINLGTSSDEGTMMDCESKPDYTSTEIACGSVGNGGDDFQAWTVVAGALGVAGANVDTAVHTDAAGHMFVATTYLRSGGVYRAISAYADSTADGATTALDYSFFNGATWTGLTSTSGTMSYATQEENIMAVPAADYGSAIFLIADASNDLFAIRFSLSGTTISTAAADSGAALEASLPGLNGTPVGMDFDPLKSPSKLTQEDYIWENDDGSTTDNNTQLAAGHGALANVPQGSRMTLRTHLKNTGGPLDDQLALFYDRNDGNWRKVQKSTPYNEPAASGCTSGSAGWSCSTIDNDTDDTGQQSVIAISPTGVPWIAYWDATNNAVMAAHYVGSGGSGCGASGSTAWFCETIATTLGTQNSQIGLIFDGSGNPWVSYYDNAAVALKWASYVGTGGTGCVTAAWTCKILFGGSLTHHTLAVGPDGTPWAAFLYSTGSALGVARYTGAAAGTNCGAGSPVGWTCEVVDDVTNITGRNPSIGFNASGIPFISYVEATVNDIRIAQYVGTGGTGCTGSTNAGTWSCATLSTDGAQNGTSMASDPSGTPWVAFTDAVNLWVGKYVGGGSGTGCTGGSTDWTCTKVDALAASTGLWPSLRFDPSGTAVVTYQDATNTALRYARNVGGTSGTGCGGSGSTAWSCSTLDDGSTSTGTYTSIAYDAQGNPWISYYDTSATALKLASYQRSGDILIANGTKTNGASLSQSHTDMTTATDSGNRTDADCLSATTWNNGAWLDNEEGTANLSGGAGTSQCTEVAWTIDTSQAVAGTTYRFVVASKDAYNADAGAWRGPISISQYPTLTISTDTADKLTKQTSLDYANCTDTSWGCTTIKANGAAGDSHGEGASIAFDMSNNPWIAWWGELDNALYVSHYIGSGGNCTDTAWTCEKVDEAVASVGKSTNLAFDAKGTLWSIYLDKTNNDVKAAWYVGDGTGNCTSTNWMCTTVDSTDNIESAVMTIGPDGRPWAAAFDITIQGFRIQHYVGSGGTGCTNTAWTCETILDTGTPVAGTVDITFDKNAVPWLIFDQAPAAATTQFIYIARATGDSAGTSCATATNAFLWKCEQVVSNGTAGSDAGGSITFDNSNIPWFSFSGGGPSLKYSKYTGTGTENTCGGGAQTNWKCATIDTAASTGWQSTIATDINGKPWIAYLDNTNDDLKIARYMGTGGSGCTGSTTAGEWSCSVVDTNLTVSNTTNQGDHVALAFDRAGIPWIAYNTADGATDSSLKVAKLHKPVDKPISTVQSYYSTRSARTTDGLYRLDDGRNGAANKMGVCNTTNQDRTGLCGLFANEGYYDSVVAAGSDEQPIFTGTFTTSTNAELPTVTWVGKSNLAPNTASTAGDIILQVYRFGSTNGWEDVASNTTSSDCSSDNCTISGLPSGTASEYFETSGSNYLIYFRIYQVKSSSAITFKTDQFSIIQPKDVLRGEKVFRNNLQRPIHR